jgi:hypothetical protein
MRKKLVLAGAVAAMAAGLAQSQTAHAATAEAQQAGARAGDPTITVTCVGPIFQGRQSATVVGDIAGLITATGDALADVLHGQESTTFTYSCANGDFRNIGNTDVRATNVRTPALRTSNARTSNARTPSTRTSNARTPSTRTSSTRTPSTRTSSTRDSVARTPDQRASSPRTPERVSGPRTRWASNY